MHTVKPLRTRTISTLVCILGARGNRSSPFSSSCCVRALSTAWEATCIVISLAAIVLYALGLCDMLYFLFTWLIPVLALIVRLRFKPWVNSGAAAAQLEFAFHDLPLPLAAVRRFDTLFLFGWMLLLATVVVWGSFTLWIPLFWDENASAEDLPLSLKIMYNVVELGAWGVGAPSYFAFLIATQATAFAVWVKVRTMIRTTRDLCGNWDRPERAADVVWFVRECLPRHMELSKALQMFNRGTSTMNFVTLSGLMWLVAAAYINLFVIAVPHDTLLWQIRPWMTCGLFSFALTIMLSPVALLTLTIVEYVRETETLLGLIAVSDSKLTVQRRHQPYEGGNKGAHAGEPEREGEGEEATMGAEETIAERARRDLTVFASVQDLAYIRVLGVAVSGTTLLKLFYTLVILFVLPLVTTRNNNSNRQTLDIRRMI